MSLRGFISAIVCSVLLWALILTAASHAACGHSKACWGRVSAKRHAHYWPRRLHAESVVWQQWAWRTSGCESTHRRVARASGYFSYFQWTLGTWHVAGGRGNPEQHSYAEQAVKAIRYARRYGTGAWPSCG